MIDTGIRGLEGGGCVVANLNIHLARRFDEDADKDFVLRDFTRRESWLALRGVVPSGTISASGRGRIQAVPVCDPFGLVRVGRIIERVGHISGFVCLNIVRQEGTPRVVGHSGNVVYAGRDTVLVNRADVVGLAVIVPGDDL